MTVPTCIIPHEKRGPLIRLFKAVYTVADKQMNTSLRERARAYLEKLEPLNPNWKTPKSALDEALKRFTGKASL